MGAAKCSNLMEKAHRIITVEPLLFIYMFAAVLSDPTQQALIYRKICIRLVNDSTICDDLQNETHRDLETQVQTDAAHWFLYAALSFEIPSVLVAFFYGSLSDHFSRKITLIVPIIGQVIAISNWIVNSMYPEAPMAYILIGPLVSGCFGGWVTLLVGTMSYLSDVSSDEDRTSRIAIAECAIALPISLSLFISGIYLEKTNFQTVLSTTLILYIVSIIYASCWIKEPQTRTLRKASVKNICTDVLGPSAVKGAFMSVFRKREMNRRKQLVILFLSLAVGIISTEPTWSLSYLYTKKHPLSWPQSLYGYYAGYSTGIRSLALLLIGPVMKKRMGMRDTSIMIMSLVTQAFSEAFMGFSTVTWMVFVAATIGVFGSAKITCQRALMSTMVEKNELGQMFAIFGSLQSLSALVANNIYNNVYPETLLYWSGMCFVIGALLSVFPLIMYIWLHKNIKKMETYSRMQGDTDIIVQCNGNAENEMKEFAEDGGSIAIVSNLCDAQKTLVTEDGAMVDIDLNKESVA